MHLLFGILCMMVGIGSQRKQTLILVVGKSLLVWLQPRVMSHVDCSYDG